MYFIAWGSVFLSVYMTLFLFLLCFNPFFDLYFPLVYWLVIGPIYYANYLFLANINKEGRDERKKVEYACLFLVVSVLLAAIWTIIYILQLYPEKYVILGFGDKESTRNFTYETKH